MKATFLMMLLLVSPVTMAQDEPLQVMLEQQQQLREDLDAGIDGLTPRQVRVIRKAQDEFFSVVADRTTLDALSISDKVRVENALETINAQIVNTSASMSDQNVCWRETKTGSGRRVTRCGTKAEAEQVRRGARDYLERPRICSGPGCG